jgi:23S rRNA (guanine745-N1)-methyltransferase
VCDAHHSFDIARQGYVNLAVGKAGPGTADTSDMVSARDRFLIRGHYRPIADAVCSLAAQHDSGAPGVVADLAGGTGYYLAGVLDALPHRHGVCIDLSVPALRRAARAHSRAAAVGADVWRALPLADRSATLVLSVFGPRNAAETDRVLAPAGALIIAAPNPGHLRELQQALGLIGIDPRKSQRLADAYGDFADPAVSDVIFELNLGHDDLTALVSMGPSARHVVAQDLAARIAALPSPATVTVDVRVSAYRRSHANR